MGFVGDIIGGAVDLVSGGVGSVVGSLIGGVASNEAAETVSDSTSQAAAIQAAATDRALAEQKRQFDISQENQNPWLGSGVLGNNRLAYLMGVSNNQYPIAGVEGDFGSLTRIFTEKDFQADPGYNFRKAEGNKEIERNASVLNSGRTLKALLDYNQNIASNEFNNAYTRYNQDQSNLFGRLSDMSAKGQATATGMANQSGNYAGTLSNLITSQGDASAASKIAGANATASGYQGIASAINNGINSYQSQNTLNNLLRNNTSTGIAPATSSYYMPANNASGSYFSDLYNF